MIKTNKKPIKGFSKVEREAMQERAQEIILDKGNGEKEILEKLNLMPEPDKSLGKKLHEIIKKNAPTLTPKTWYGMPAYADKNGKIICFFQNASKFKARYSTLGFSDLAKLDNGEMWPTSFALKKLTEKEKDNVIKLIKKAIS